MHKNLPHIDALEHFQFVTFRTKDSIDDFLKRTFFEDIDNKIKQYKIDKHLDNSTQGAYLYGKVVDDIIQYFLSYDGKIFDIIALSIMPNHIHILFKQKKELSETIRILKGGSAHIINKALDKKGKLWAGKYYDTVIRDEKHFETVYNYRKNNPLKANLKDAEKRFYGVYE